MRATHARHVSPIDVHATHRRNAAEIEGHLSHLNGKIGGPVERMIERWFLIQRLSTAALAREASMTRLSIRNARVPMAPHWRPTYALLRALVILDMIFDTFDEANRIARENHRRYPFAEW